MPAKKAAKKTAKKAAAKPKIKSPIVPLYGRPIYEAIARGNPTEMRALAVKARKHISDVQTALGKLEAKLK